MVTSFKGLPKLQDGISTLGLTAYGRRYMEATMVLYSISEMAISFKMHYPDLIFLFMKL